MKPEDRRRLKRHIEMIVEHNAPTYYDVCSRCGMMKVIVDSYTNFGSQTDTEPPEPVILCADCVKEEVAMWISLDTMPAHWIHASYEKELAEIMGFEFVQDTGSAWGSWQPNEGRLNNEK